MSGRGGHRRFNKFEHKGKYREKSFTPSTPYSHKNFDDRCTRFIAQEKLSETEAGITEYVGSVPGFSGIIKARFSDFHVNEINNCGEIAKLTDTTEPKDFEDGTEADTKTNLTDLTKCPIEQISGEKWKEINEMLESSDEDKFVEIEVTTLSKEDRTDIHEGVRKVFGRKIIAHTKVVDEQKLIVLRKHVKGAPRDFRLKWPKDKGEYVYFLMYKEVADTMEATFKISDCLRMKSSMFTYAGVKDRRAKTTQWFCVKKIDPRKLIRRCKFLRNIHVGNISYKDEPLKLGQLNGNRFRIALRNVTADDVLIDDAMESLKSQGFINYYGLQRFGNDKQVPTFEIGLKLLQSKWKEACDLILKPKSSDDPKSDITHGKRVYKATSNSQMAVKEFNRNHNKCVESKLLLGFAKNHENDYVNALENIPRNMRLLYLHAFQSLVWNKIASRRVKEFGLKPIVGDLVLVLDRPEPSVDDVPEINSDDTTEDEAPTQEVKLLTEQDLDNHTIYDIVLPLPGYDVKYPENEVKTWYKEILDEYGLTLEMPKQKVKTYTLSGDYRKILGQVKDLSWKTMKYDHPNDTLIRSDYEELTGEAEPQDSADGQYKALIIDFCLNSSHYATMVLREILKIDTSTAAHAKLNKYHEPTTTNETENATSEGNGKKVPFAEADSLLSDATKYEAFKQQIFGATKESEALKRKAEEDEEVGASKKSKATTMESSEPAIKIQPSLV